MKRILIEAIYLCFTILFLYSGISKLLDYFIFVEQLALFPWLAPFRSWLAILLPGIEILTAIAFFFPKLRLIALYCSSIMMVAFTVFVIVILNYNEELPCTCGGLLEQLSWNQHLILNCVLSVFAVTGIIIQRNVNRKDRSLMAANFVTL